ncbi:PREDICTED: ubiquitin carboxyl-terminal hydrolase-like [Papilio polytes]|uniref:ubiquitin carboxyl-terminal hydrolase-like n=1 Tax=Papilio polytes TaxID=76194 RepID=UPI000675E8E1|nr:PREDICTED: ubiquitin carboxyl-terminal hydrolase-like [Papilio polytes]
MSAVLAMESNPETMNKYLKRLGVSDKWRMVDVISLDEEALDWVPRPVLALTLLFPLSTTYEDLRSKEEQDLLSKGHQAPKDVFHLRQVLSNVCGTIALVHSVANNTHHIELEEGILATYLKNAKGLDAAAKGALLENSAAMLEAYKDVVAASSNEEVTASDTVSHHFVTFVHKDGTLYELDGRKSFPIEHGSTNEDRFLEDAAKVLRSFIAREPDNICFNVMALVPEQ